MQGMLYILWVVAGLMLLMWLVGVSGAFAVGTGVHMLLIVAVLAVMASLFTRPRIV